MTTTIYCFFVQLTDVCNTMRCEELGQVTRRDRDVRQSRKMASVGYLQHCCCVRRVILRDTLTNFSQGSRCCSWYSNRFSYFLDYLFYHPIRVAATPKAWVCDRSPTEIVGSNTNGVIDVCLLWVLCCQVEVSATSWSLVQRSPTDYGASLCVI